jgi:hypothetical protein
MIIIYILIRKTFVFMNISLGYFFLEQSVAVTILHYTKSKTNKQPTKKIYMKKQMQ